MPYRLRQHPRHGKARRWARCDNTPVAARTNRGHGRALQGYRLFFAYAKKRPPTAPFQSLTHGCGTYCVLQRPIRCIWKIVLRPAAPLSGAATGVHAWGYRMYPQNCNAILKTLLALPAMSFAKSPRMDFLHKKERSGSTTTRAYGAARVPYRLFWHILRASETDTMHMCAPTIWCPL